MAKIEKNPGAADAKWTGQIEDLIRYPSYQDAVGLDGEASEFEWKNFRGFTTLTTVKEIQIERKNRTGELQRPDYLYVYVQRHRVEKNDENCISNAEKIKDYAKRFLPRHWTFLGPGSEKKWYGNSYDGQWNCTVNKMVQQFKETGHLIFTATSAVSRGKLKEAEEPFTSMEIS